MAPQIDSSNSNDVLNVRGVREVATVDIKDSSLPLETSEPDAIARADAEDTVDDATADEENKKESDDDDSQYNDFLDSLKAPSEYVDFLDFIKSPKNDGDEVSSDFLDYLKSPPKPEQAADEKSTSEEDDWASLLNENENAADDISWSDIMEAKAQDGSINEDSLTAFIASLASKHDNKNEDPKSEADFDAFLQFFNSLPTDEKASAIRNVQKNNNKESTEAIWDDILSGMQKGVSPGELPQSWFGYFCEMFTQSLTKVQPVETEEGKGEQELTPVATMV